MRVEAIVEDSSDGADVTSCDRPFQSRDVTLGTGYARTLMVDSSVRRTISDGDEAEHRRFRASKSAGWLSSSTGYDSAAPCRHLQIQRRIQEFKLGGGRKFA